jgi:hypothetical protein
MSDQLGFEYIRRVPFYERQLPPSLSSVIRFVSFCVFAASPSHHSHGCRFTPESSASCSLLAIMRISKSIFRLHHFTSYPSKRFTNPSSPQS